MRETVLNFGENKSLFGIITDPAPETKQRRSEAVILLNSGILHRVGPHRLYVKLARTLAMNGFIVFRFDLSGIGDSQACEKDISFEKRTLSEIQEAMDRLNTLKNIDRFILMGICSGADMAFKAACNDKRIVGAVPINARKLQHIDDHELSRNVQSRHAFNYLLKVSLFNPDGWLKLITGKADYRRILKTIGLKIRGFFKVKEKDTPVSDKIKLDIRLLIDRGVKLLFVYSEVDPGLAYLREMLGKDINKLSKSEKFRIEIVKADHTFTFLESQRSLINLILNWM